MDKPLRILGIVNLPWDPRLGAARVWFELSEQWKKAGHRVDKFCLSDAFATPTRSRALFAWRQATFPYQAARFVRPYGLNEIERVALANAAQSARDRLARKEICFLGMWSVRKGSRDWPKIVRAVLNAEPSARFAFLGTMTDDETVFRELSWRES